MDASFDVNIESQSQSDIILTCSQPSLSISSIITGSNKRGNPDSPDSLPATQKQSTRQIRRRHSNSIGDLRGVGERKTPTLRKTVADKVLDALNSPEVLNVMIPLLSQKISDTLTPIIEQEAKKFVDIQIQPLLKQIKEQETVIQTHKQHILKQFIQISNLEQATSNHITTIKEQGKDLDCLSDEIADLKIRVESQEQYSRRTSLRFHNIPVPVDNHGKILHPVNTDEIVLDIIRNKLNINIDLNDIGRSHVIGKARKGRSQVIVRFISYRMKHLVYSNKKELKGDTNGIFITENLSQYRTELVKSLADMKTKNQISAYWTADGRIFVKKSVNSRKLIIQNWQDVGDLRPPFKRPAAYDNHPDNQPDSANSNQRS
ncbi:Hypothetical predicted protein [Mytilus galloprovincialis]|uniref:Uncharacterized protein n=1 Tax=Mytilus galloprovincialis TaxID=29158 RepID=A0A8B6E0N9_MYTGA|nr:Hypothetical predicted protein [Mytilus galloprovincialis]